MNTERSDRPDDLPLEPARRIRPVRLLGAAVAVVALTAVAAVFSVADAFDRSRSDAPTATQAAFEGRSLSSPSFR